jgi:hypothetical protein
VSIPDPLDICECSLDPPRSIHLKIGPNSHVWMSYCLAVRYGHDLALRTYLGFFYVSKLILLHKFQISILMFFVSNCL